MDIPSAKSTGITAETKFKVMPYGRDINIIKSICEYLIFDCNNTSAQWGNNSLFNKLFSTRKNNTICLFHSK